MNRTTRRKLTLTERFTRKGQKPGNQTAPADDYEIGNPPNPRVRKRAFLFRRFERLELGMLGPSVTQRLGGAM